MRTFLDSFFILCLCFTTARSLECTRCTDYSGEGCSQTTSACPANTNTCVFTYSELRIANQVVPLTTKTCGNDNECNQISRMTLAEDTSFLRSSTCCNSDNCTSPTPILPVLDTTPNGFSCPACYLINSTSCQSTGTIACRGDETRCIRMSINGGATFSLAFQGCSSANICSMQQYFNGLNSQLNYGVACCDPSSQGSNTCTV
ncbi:phospholipase A2 inhibitor gamma subunit B-like [Spea bombifrons]|uniref:phospholipase A2 inhibitor gamma subunit B-like n=1 Tax=Spea bombifrons TaxID=233779 RepID=UPI00234953A0|nr:phospholipase A2 inhibitor gamma subunit B-like [Spea bombifrons]